MVEMTMLGERFASEWKVSGRDAAVWASQGYLVFGPGPRGWTFVYPDGHGAAFEVVGERGGVWTLKKKREF